MVFGVCTPAPAPPPPRGCETSPIPTCQNGGECRAVETTVFGQATSSTQCKCEISFAGPACECSISALGTVHGDCTATPGSSCQLWTCNCHPGWVSSGNTAGRYCDTPTTHPTENGGTTHTQACPAPPTPNVCQHGGVCSASMMLGVAMATCQCPSSYGGVHCETQDTVNGQVSTQHCAAAASSQGGVACSGHGTCVDLFGTYQCQCAPGYGGTDCEQHDSVDDCANGNECSGHGTCVDTFFGFECTCNAGWGGTTCTQQEASSDPCASQPCLNGGACVAQFFGNDHGYTCTCTPNNFGQHCEQHDDVNQCTTTPCCSAGGACVDLFSEAMCNCHAGFSGASCNQQMINGMLTTMSQAQCGGSAGGGTTGGGSAGTYTPPCTGTMVFGVCTPAPPPPPPTTNLPNTLNCLNGGTQRAVQTTVFGQVTTRTRVRARLIRPPTVVPHASARSLLYPSTE